MKLVLLVLLVLVVVLEREENLVLRVMLAHLDPRYINNTWEVLCYLPFTEPWVSFVLVLSLQHWLLIYLFFQGPPGRAGSPGNKGEMVGTFHITAIAALCW